MVKLGRKNLTKKQRAELNQVMGKGNMAKIEKGEPTNAAKKLANGDANDAMDLTQAALEAAEEWVRMPAKEREGKKFSSRGAMQKALTDIVGKGVFGRRQVEEGQARGAFGTHMDDTGTVAQKPQPALTELDTIKAEGEALGIKVDEANITATQKRIADAIEEATGRQLTLLQ